MFRAKLFAENQIKQSNAKLLLLGDWSEHTGPAKKSKTPNQVTTCTSVNWSLFFLWFKKLSFINAGIMTYSLE
jgi:hypothetical protein